MAVLVGRLRDIIGKLDGHAEAVLADDGSNDSGIRRLVALSQRRPLLPRQ